MGRFTIKEMNLSLQAEKLEGQSPRTLPEIPQLLERCRA